MNKDEILLGLYEACLAEYIYCPWCAGRIQGIVKDSSTHESYCPLASIEFADYIGEIKLKYS